MPTRQHNPTGAPCWADLWTSDVDGSRRFYAELFGWEANDPSPEFGGYFMFTRDGVPVCGAMGDMGDMKANDTWKIYLDTDEVAKTAELAAAQGAEIVAPPMPVADLGVQLVLTDPTGAHVGAWQPGTFPGFTVLDEHGAPGWCELFTRDFTRSLDFYRRVFRWETELVGDTDEFRYATMRNPEGDGELAGVMDASGFLPEGVPAHWSIYWQVDDAAASVATVVSLGGSVVDDVQDTPYGKLATVRDPAGATFKLRTPPGQ
jgi:predicted enzyme related to lactoylglutathione lyase